MLSKRRLAVALAVGCCFLASTPQPCFADQKESLIHDTFIVPTITKANTSDYEVSVESISLTDSATGISDIATIHNSRPFDVTAKLHWEEQVYDLDSTNTLSWEMSVDGVVANTGSVDLSESRALPATLNAGQTTIDNSGTHNIKVKISLDSTENANDRNYESFAAGASFVPLMIVILFAATTQMVELSLGMGILVGSCMVAGTLVGGFRTMLDKYLLNALANKDHGYVFLFILFMAGLVGLIEKSGGLKGITHALQGYVKTSRSAQSASFFAGILIFFDDYANTLVAGASMKPLTDACGVSREKLAFIVDATAAPIASIVPISSWVGFEISLIQAELDAILQANPDSEIGNTSAFAVFLETIKYRYYCIFMLILIPLLILSGRDFGPMLVAERLTKVYGRTDGGPGAALATDGQAIVSHNTPKLDTPPRWWNMACPIITLIGYTFYLLIWTGQQSGKGGESFIELIELANAYQALLWGTMAAALTSLLFFFIQDKKDGRIIFFNVKGYINKMRRFSNRHVGKCHRRKQVESSEYFGEDGGEEEHAKVLMDYREAMSSFLVGTEKIFGALVVLTLAWATGATMQAVGLNRFFGEILTNPALDYRMLPTLTFIIAILIAFSTGTSWGTMTIMFPLVLGPSYNASGGDPVIFYGVTAGILAGAVAGDHASPISDTTILASMASECEILQHVKTQAPYALMVCIWSVLVGTIPSGLGTFPNWVSILLGFVVMLLHVVVTSECAINKTGRYDIFTELYLHISGDEFLRKLKEDTVIAFENGEPVSLDNSAKLIEDEETGPVKDHAEISSPDKSESALGYERSSCTPRSSAQEHIVMNDVENWENTAADVEKSHGKGEISQ